MTTPATHRLILDETTRFDSLIESVAEALDVPDSAYEQAKKRYEAVGAWLSVEGSPLRDALPVIYPQGSFALGTVNRPLRGPRAEYDIDAVVELKGPVRNWTASQLKQLVGDRLREHGTYRAMLAEEGRRCWTLDYAAASGEPGFHMDLLPSVRGGTDHPGPGSATAIAITNRTPVRLYEWRPSDPKGYQAWFRGRMRVRLDSHGVPMSESWARIEAVPANDVRSPLQQAVRILKRHRDVMFLHDPDTAPISIILTTLASHAYGGEASLGATFLGIVSRIGVHIDRSGGRVRVPNPVRPEENFADRWEGDARKEVAFEVWLEEVRTLGERLKGQPVDTIERELVDMLGESVARESVALFARRLDGRSSTLVGDRRVVLAESVLHKEFPALEPARAGHRQVAPWPDHTTQYRVRVRGKIVGGNGARRGPIECRRSRVLPGANLEFETVTNAPPGAEYFWQVVNTGADAERANGLRGDFDRGDRTRSESALYRGMHSIECFVVHRGECVGRSGPFFVRIGTWRSRCAEGGSVGCI